MNAESLGSGECFHILAERLGAEQAAPWRRGVLALFQKCRVYLKALRAIPRNDVHQWCVRQVLARFLAALSRRQLPPILDRTARGCLHAMCRDEIRARTIPWFASGQARTARGKVAALIRVADHLDAARTARDARVLLRGYPRTLPVVLDFEGVREVGEPFLQALERRGNTEARNLD
jgi:hypothetical protein